MTDLRLKVLGGFELGLTDGRPLTIRSKKLQALVAYLALSAGVVHPRNHLWALLWGERGDTEANASFRQALAQLRRLLAPAAVDVVHPLGIGLPKDGITVDVAAFEVSSPGEPRSRSAARSRCIAESCSREWR